MSQTNEVRASRTVFVERIACQTVAPPYPACITQQYTIVVEAYGDNRATAIRNLNGRIDTYVCASVGGRGGGVSVQRCERQEVTTEVVPKRKNLITQLRGWVTSLI